MVSSLPIPPSASRPTWWSVAFVLAVGLFAWWGTWNGGYLFDDHPAIEQHGALLAGDWLQAAFGPVHQPFANRPFATLSLVIDFRLFGGGPFAPHLGNLLLHLGNAVLLLLVVRRALLAPNLHGRFGGDGATGLATAVAMLWVAHPLAGDAVAYATQRSTLLFSGCLLLALWAILRAHDSPRPGWWRAVAVLAMALGMASKEDMVAGPILVVLFERAFLLPNQAALRARAGFYLAFAATWSVLLLCVANGPANLTVGYDTVPRISALEWLYTQAGVVAHYLRLSLWPHPLRGAYDQDYVRELGPALLPGLSVLAVLVAFQLQWRRRPWWAWLGLWCFLLLAPTSTILPIRSEVVAERRMYLPMLLLIVPMVLLANRLLAGRLPAWARLSFAGTAAFGLALVAQQRVAVYRDEPAFWADAYAKRTPGSQSHLAAQILGNHAAMLFGQSRFDEAFALFDQMMRCESPTTTQWLQYAASQQMCGNHEQGIGAVERVLEIDPDNAEAIAYLGISLTMQLTDEGKPNLGNARAARAETALRRAVELQPDRSDAWNALGKLMQAQERYQEAESALLQAIRLAPQRLEQYDSLREVLRSVGREADLRSWLQQIQQQPSHREVATQLLRSWYQSK